MRTRTIVICSIIGFIALAQGFITRNKVLFFFALSFGVFLMLTSKVINTLAKKKRESFGG